MGTALRLEQFARDQHYELQVIGIPKTIDNDLMETGHTPGYGSAARFFAHAARDVGADNRSLPSPDMHSRSAGPQHRLDRRSHRACRRGAGLPTIRPGGHCRL